MEETIEHRARLVKLSIKKWTARKFDANVSQDNARTAGAYKDHTEVGRFNKILIPERDARTGKLTSYGKLEYALKGLRAEHRAHTLPWSNGDAGYRLLPGEKFLEHAEGLRKYISDYEAARDTFFQEYPQLIKDAQTRLGPLFNSGDYHKVYSWDVDKRWGIYAQYKVSLDTKPVPQTDFRAKLTRVELDDLERSTQARIDAAVKEALERAQVAGVEHSIEPADTLLDALAGVYGK